MKVIAFGATNSTTSINKKLAAYTAGLIDKSKVEVIDLNDFEMPIYSVEREQESGIHPLAEQFYNKISQADALVISFAEYNGTYTAAFKNILDWVSRINKKFYQGKPVIMLATSPGPGGASSVLSYALESAPYFDADVKGSLSFPDFFSNFDIEANRITNDALLEDLRTVTSRIMA
ncbi:NADPH-dependent FMN reductase [Vibrio sp. SCSIO 43137]|uniref:NADPH-dependent FMN reductase n=1 Tax=Vibrio sp. SCSIO 43137 TaxID=3021011 RepID=UPI002307B2F0|nr:NAD(P)H-dependent oxidoreductase [Vibrio sp. SCSIO 43137]WCE31606.1 NAD(P)H-dependent oxidoreductase [Vibrio sp. SCSIO 43137]